MKQRLTKITAFLLIAILLFCALPVVAGAASVSTESALRTNVNKGGTIKLTKDIKLSERLVIPTGKTVTLDLNGKKLYRELTECHVDGNVILVLAGATLTLSDTLKAHGGTVTGGVAPRGGGIMNQGSLTVNHGVRIVGNYANSAYTDGISGEREREDCGGGIYNAAHASLTLSGGEISGNEAFFGGGVFNDPDATITIVPGSYTEVVDGVKKTLESNVTVTDNQAAAGCGIYSGSDLSLSGAAEINGNDHNDDLRMESGLKITCGALTYTTPIGVSIEGLEASKAYTFTSGFGANNTGLPKKYFFCPDRAVTLNITSAQNGELRLNRGMKKTVVEVFEKGSLTKIEEFDSPAKAWTAAKKYCVKNPIHCSFESAEKANSAGKDWWPKYRTDSGQFKKWRDNILDIMEQYETGEGLRHKPAPEIRASLEISEVTLLKDHTVKVTLGSDWVFTDSQSVDHLCDVTIDLNGHCIRRVDEQNSGALPAGVIISSSGGGDGNLFDLDEFARLTILDSNPDSDGFAAIKGGVISGGDGDDIGGCFVLDKFAELNILGGTVYDCKTDKHGGAIYAKARGAKINLKDCVFDACKTEDSSDDCHGGAIYVANAILLTAENVTFARCYSEDNGGAVYLENRPGNIKMKNVTFDDNEAKDNGGAICIGDIDGEKRFMFEAAHCTFTSNVSGVDGGAVRVKDNDDSVYEEPIIFRGCTFTGNTARDGSAFELDDNSVALLSCTITENKASRSGAVYVNDARSVSVGGTTVIKNNTGKDLLLDKDGNKTRVYPVGLINGAEIVVSSDSTDKSTVVMKDIDQRQVQYFRSESGTRLEFSKTGEREARMVVASLFGNRSVWLVILIAAVAVVAAMILVIKKKKDGRKTEHDA